MGDLARCFDYGAFLRSKRQADDGRELFMYDYTMGANNNVFREVRPLFSLSPHQGFPKGKAILSI